MWWRWAAILIYDVTWRGSRDVTSGHVTSGMTESSEVTLLEITFYKWGVTSRDWKWRYNPRWLPTTTVLCHQNGSILLMGTKFLYSQMRPCLMDLTRGTLNCFPSCPMTPTHGYTWIHHSRSTVMSTTESMYVHLSNAACRSDELLSWCPVSHYYQVKYIHLWCSIFKWVSDTW